MMFNTEVNTSDDWIDQEIQKELDQLDANSESTDDEHSLTVESHSECKTVSHNAEVSSCITQFFFHSRDSVLK
jgi:hypothetical protein